MEQNKQNLQPINAHAFALTLRSATDGYALPHHLSSCLTIHYIHSSEDMLADKQGNETYKQYYLITFHNFQGQANLQTEVNAYWKLALRVTKQMLKDTTGDDAYYDETPSFLDTLSQLYSSLRELNFLQLLPTEITYLDFRKAIQAKYPTEDYDATNWGTYPTLDDPTEDFKPIY